MKDPATAVSLAVHVVPLDAGNAETFAAAERIDEWLNRPDPDNPGQPAEDVYVRRSRAFSEAIRAIVGSVPGDTLDDVLTEAERRFRAGS